MTTSASVFIRRYRMQIELSKHLDWIRGEGSIGGELRGREFDSSPLRLREWHSKLTSLHALAKWESFRQEMDGNVFACLADREGCKQLMRDLAARDNFVPEATWLALAVESRGEEKPIGTIQGLRVGPVLGAIQNIGVVPDWRGRGLGKELIRRALGGFLDTGCRTVSLEVTTHNLSAIGLYQSVGFEIAETVFKYCYLNIQR